MLEFLLGACLVAALVVAGLALADTLTQVYNVPRSQASSVAMLAGLATLLVALLGGSMTPVLYATGVYCALFVAVAAHQGLDAVQTQEHIRMPVMLVPLFGMLWIVWAML